MQRRRRPACSHMCVPTPPPKLEPHAHPPLQMAATPTRPCLQRSTFSSVTISRVPLAPMGCPIATAPPNTFTLQEQGQGQGRRTAKAMSDERWRRRRRRRAGRQAAAAVEHTSSSVASPCRVQLEQLAVGQVDHRKGLVDLPVIDVLGAQACSQRMGDGGVGGSPAGGRGRMLLPGHRGGHAAAGRAVGLPQPYPSLPAHQLRPVLWGWRAWEPWGSPGGRPRRRRNPARAPAPAGHAAAPPRPRPAPPPRRRR